MKYPVHPPQFLAQAKEYRTDGIGNATGQQPVKACPCHYGHGLRQEKDNALAHKNIADHGKNSIFFQINSCERYGNGSKPPLHCEKSTGDFGKYR